MKIKILKAVATPYGRLVAGVIIDMPDDLAKEWCKTGLAKQEENEIETTSIEPRENAILRRAKPRRRNGNKAKNRTHR